MMVDKETELMQVGVLPSVLVYHYRFVNLAADEASAAALVDALRPMATVRACTTPETRDGLLKRGITMRFSYADRTGVFIGAFDVADRSCAQ